MQEVFDRYHRLWYKHSVSKAVKFLAPEDLKYRTRALLLIGLVTAYHLLIIGAVGPGDNEAYYWTWSQHLDISYFDHPPIVAYMIALTTAVGGDSPFFLRLGTVVLFCITSLLIYLLALELTGSRQTAFRSLFLANIIPLFFMVGILTVPDAPLAVFWLLYLYLLLKVNKGVSWRHWYLMGFVLGLGILSKYFAVLLVPSTLLYLLSDRELRKYLKTPHPYLAFFLSAAVASPILLWNTREDWASFGYHLSTRHEGGFSWANVWKLLVGQLGVITPLLLILAFVTLFIFMKRGLKAGGDLKHKFIVWTSAPTLVFFYIIMCLTNDAEPHWPGLGYMPLFIGAAWLYPEYLVRKRNLLKGPSAFKLFVALSMAIPILFVLALNIQLMFPVYRPAMVRMERAEDLTGWEVGSYDATSDLFGWAEVGEKVKEVTMELAEEGSFPFIFCCHYNPASQLSFALKDAENVYCLSKGIDQFDFWQDIRGLIGRNAVYVTTNRYDLPPEEGFIFERIEGPETVVTYRAGNYKIRETSIYRCYGFLGQK